ncbi:Glycosyltransferase involved in cell wall bisynthesis [Tenacibaculum sp. 190524A05c]|uniref:glycosyltransferase n=1 Tax=Tenacibaculum platacis TaxID=3137852 RepID=UPI0031FAFA31
MKILHIVEDFSVKSGGLRTVIANLDFFLKKHGYDSYILSSDQEKEDDIFIVEASNGWLYSKEWKPKINHIVKTYHIDIIHIHGVWLCPQYVGAKYAVQNNIPLVFSCHGMYQPWLWKKGTLKKKIYLNLVSKKWFKKANIIHSITDNETKNIKKYFPKNSYFEIPNLISFSENSNEFKADGKYIFYLGRLNKTKGIDILIKAFAQLNNKNIQLKIAGGFNEYKAELDKLVHELGLSERVSFLGEVKGNEKTKLIREAWVMASPTFSDVIGMVNLEAALNKTPMITTHKTGLKEGWNTNGGYLINPNIKELTAKLKEAISWNAEERKLKGEQLYEFAKQNYSWSEQFYKWEELYTSILKNKVHVK